MLNSAACMVRLPVSFTSWNICLLAATCSPACSSSQYCSTAGTCTDCNSIGSGHCTACSSASQCTACEAGWTGDTCSEQGKLVVFPCCMHASSEQCKSCACLGTWLLRVAHSFRYKLQLPAPPPAPTASTAPLLAPASDVWPLIAGTALPAQAPPSALLARRAGAAPRATSEVGSCSWHLPAHERVTPCRRTATPLSQSPVPLPALRASTAPLPAPALTAPASAMAIALHAPAPHSARPAKRAGQGIPAASKVIVGENYMCLSRRFLCHSSVPLPCSNPMCLRRWCAWDPPGMG